MVKVGSGYRKRAYAECVESGSPECSVPIAQSNGKIVGIGIRGYYGKIQFAIVIEVSNGNGFRLGVS